MASLALLATSCTKDEALPSETAYERASDSDLNDAIQNNLGGIYEFGETYEHGILERVPARYEKCGDTVDGFRYDTRDTSVVLLGNAISAEELQNALDAKDLSVMRQVQAPSSQLAEWYRDFDTIWFWPIWAIIFAIATLMFLGRILSFLRSLSVRQPQEKQTQVNVATPRSSIVIEPPQEPNELEAVYENGDTRMSLWVRGPRPEAFVLSYQKGNDKSETLSFEPRPQKKEEDAPPA